jgi:hypothetical protein
MRLLYLYIFTESVVSLIARLLSLGHPEVDRVQEKPRTIGALKDIIQLEIAETENDVLQRTADNLELRVQICRAEGGGRFQQLMLSHPVHNHFQCVSA